MSVALLAFFSCGLLSTAFAETIVSGTISQNTVWSSAWSPYVVNGSLTIASDVELVIDPGVVVKFKPQSSSYASMRVYGALTADGTEGSPIVFTSIKDDSYGGDTNNDGDATSPGKDDWGTIYLFGSGVLNHVIVQYGGGVDGGSNSQSLIACYSSSPTITNSQIAYTTHKGIYCGGSESSPQIRDNIISECGEGIRTGSGAQPVIAFNDISGTSYGIYNLTSSIIVSAENNWWGHETGPYHPTTNPDGLGSQVSDYVDFDPWLGDPVSSQSLAVMMPNGGEEWPVGSEHEITWTSTGEIADVKIEYSIDGGLSWGTIENSTPNDGAHTWVVENTPSTTCLVRISDAVDGEPLDASDGTFTIVVPQSITVTLPVGGELWPVGSEQEITWSSEGTIVSVEIEYSVDGGLVWIAIEGSTPNDGSYTWVVANTPSTHCLVKISDADDGDPSDIGDGTFTIGQSQSPVADAGTDQIVFSGYPVQFDASDSYDPDGTIVSYEWDFSDGEIASETIAIHRFRGAMNQSRTYTVILSIEDNLGEVDTDIVHVTVVPLEKTVEVTYEPYSYPYLGEIAYGRMVVSYNWIRENTYVISRIDYETEWFTGFGAISVLDLHSHWVPVPLWIATSPSLGFKEEVTYYPNLVKVQYGGDIFEGISVDGVDAMQMYITGWAGISISEGPFVPPPFFEIQLDCFEPGLTEAPEPSADLPDLNLAHIYSPGELRVYDSEGRITGLVNEGTRAEIPQSWYSDGVVMVLNPSGSHRYRVVGTSEGTYGLTVASTKEGDITTLIAMDIPTSANAVHQYAVDWEALSQGEQGVTVQIDSDADGSFEQTITTGSTFAYVPPIADAGGPYSVDEGSSVVFAPSGSDPDGDPFTFAWDLDNDGIFETPGQSATFSAAELDGPSSHTIVVQVTDSDGLSATDETTVEVLNVAPAATFIGTPETINEGESASLTFSDPFDPSIADRAIGLLYSYDCMGDGTFEQNDISELSWTCAYPDNGDFVARGRIQDKDGDATEYTAEVTVNNIAPVVGEIVASVEPVEVHTVIDANAAFADAGALDTHTAEWDWGDGSTSSGTMNETDGSGVVGGSHTYIVAGIYMVTLTVTDKDGDSGQSTFEYIVIYDPDGGFATGGGWIHSPAGAYVPDPSLMGKANFGFVSKYKKGATTPTGQTEFQFKAGDLNFHSNSYDWLVIAGPKAMYKGVGTINGGGEYRFQLSAIDAALTPSTDADLFRMRIWGDGLVYDNKVGETDDHADPTTVIGGGNIKIHKKDAAKSVSPMPAEYALHQNAPNPFNPETTIEYAIPAEVYVRLAIYNAMGQTVRVLVNGSQPAGYHQIVWDSRDDRGRPVSGGVYLYRMTAGDFAETRRMILLR